MVWDTISKRPQPLAGGQEVSSTHDIFHHQNIALKKVKLQRGMLQPPLTQLKKVFCCRGA
jgi:hypothetical protein